MLLRTATLITLIAVLPIKSVYSLPIATASGSGFVRLSSVTDNFGEITDFADDITITMRTVLEVNTQNPQDSAFAAEMKPVLLNGQEAFSSSSFQNSNRLRELNSYKIISPNEGASFINSSFLSIENNRLPYISRAASFQSTVSFFLENMTSHNLSAEFEYFVDFNHFVQIDIPVGQYNAREDFAFSSMRAISYFGDAGTFPLSRFIIDEIIQPIEIFDINGDVPFNKIIAGQNSGFISGTTNIPIPQGLTLYEVRLSNTQALSIPEPPLFLIFGLACIFLHNLRVNKMTNTSKNC